MSLPKVLFPWVSVIILIFVLGIVGTVYSVKNFDKEFRNNLLSRSETIAAGVNDELITSLSGSPNDLNLDSYQDLKQSLMRIRSKNADVRFIYIMGVRDDKLFFNVDSESVDSPDYSAPGDIYDSSKFDLEKIKKGIPFVQGPYTDQWGVWISAIAPIIDYHTEDPTILGTVGLDVSANMWNEQILLSAAVPLLITLFLEMVLILYLVSRWRKQKYINQIETEREKLKIILENLPVGVVVVKTSNQILEIANQTATDLVGKSIPLSKIDESIVSYYNIETEKGNPYDFFDLPQFVSMKTGSSYSKNDIFIRKTNTERINLKITSAPVKNKAGKIETIILVFQDVTKEREIDRMKTEFISIASHQLRTPLTALKWFVQLMLSGKTGELTQLQKEYIQDINNSTERMIDLVNSLLNISRIESGRIIVDPQPTNIANLFEEVLATLYIRMGDKKQHISKNIPTDLPKINVDHKLIREVILNLLTNAIKYTPEGGKITISIELTEKNIKCIVQDTGVGIPLKDKDRVFQKFYRGENVLKLDNDGNGLGLYLVRSILDSSGGEVSFESEEGKGTSFCFTLPLEGSVPKKGEVSLT